MTFLKKLEHINKIFTYAVLRMILRNKPVKYPIDKGKIKKILILRYDAIGDMVVTLPAIDLLRKIIPAAEIHVLASHRNFDIIRHDHRIDKIIIHSGNPKKIFSELKVYKKENYDLILSFVFNKTTFAGIVANYACRRAIKVNPREENRAELYSTFFNIQLPIADLRDRMTMLEILCKMLERLFGIEMDNYPFEYRIILPKESIDAADRFENENPGRKVFLNISAGNPYRTLSSDKNIELLGKLVSMDKESQFFILSAPNDLNIAEMIVSKLRNKQVKLLPPCRNILDVASLISKSSLVITPDTSIVHLSAVAGKPTITLYSKMASFINEWMPYNVPFEAVITEKREPLDNISTDRIADAYKKMMENQFQKILKDA